MSTHEDKGEQPPCHQHKTHGQRRLHLRTRTALEKTLVAPATLAQRRDTVGSHSASQPPWPRDSWWAERDTPPCTALRTGTGRGKGTASSEFHQDMATACGEAAEQTASCHAAAAAARI